MKKNISQKYSFTQFVGEGLDFQWFVFSSESQQHLSHNLPLHHVWGKAVNASFFIYLFIFLLKWRDMWYNVSDSIG